MSLNRHYLIINDDITESKLTKKYDFITCISVLEHIPVHKEAMKGMFDLLNPGGHLLLTVPFNEEKYIDNVYKMPEASYGKDHAYICQIFSRKNMNTWLADSSWEIVEQEYYEVFTGELWTFGEHIYPPKKVEQNEKSHLSCILLRKKGD